ncbi:atypical kinase COQ8B, mitochondrial isoform X1 [Trichogramma pretiosum]|uniref:atypical kinase COQ8B, mitochondrial isoform X1 n=1 Tax=Trichogramma pretiosum TaxID=7493 RepID=UPI0006C99D43|nr:atypical kinase COQ8B, mitochondrial isoform X1 [Trichogramma pretiosum]
MSRKISDTVAVLRGMKIVVDAVLREQEKKFPNMMKQSNVQNYADEGFKGLEKLLGDIDASKVPEKLGKDLKEFAEKLHVIEKGLSQYSKIRLEEVLGFKNLSEILQEDLSSLGKKLQVFDPSKDPKEVPYNHSNVSSENAQASTASYAAQSNENVQKSSSNINRNQSPVKYASVKEKIETISAVNSEIPKVELSERDKQLLRKLEIEHEEKIRKQQGHESESSGTTGSQSDPKENLKSKPKVYSKPISYSKPKDTLSENAKARKVPSTRIGRMVSFGTLGVGLGVGTLAEYARRSLGFKEASVGQTLDSMFLTKANAERIVATLCKVRGAALKIGQILSIQDNTIISPELQQAFERVRQSADFMPTWQVQKVLASELGHDWREKLATFDDKPFAAASIGQVHHATLKDGRPVAMKIQYPGVAAGIQSDIENLVGVMKVWNMFPEGMFIDNVVEVAKRELSWEVDYVREAECTKVYRKLVEPYPEYYVPEVIDEFCTNQIFTSELIEGVPIDKCADSDMETREHICRLIMELCLKELFVFRYMQTDPNWSNFFYNTQTKQLILLDFGACRSYTKEFMDKYIEVINGASEGDRGKVLQISREMGFLTGYESKVMEEAHVDAVMILGQVFDRDHKYFDFGGQDVTRRIQALVPTIVHHRLCPPPEEIYSLHRKLSGVFLLCAKMNVKINCRDMFREVYRNYKFD